MGVLRQVSLCRRSRAVLLMLCTVTLLLSIRYHQSTYQAQLAYQRPLCASVYTPELHTNQQDIDERRGQDKLISATVSSKDIPQNGLHNSDSFSVVSSVDHRLVTATESTITQAGGQVGTQATDQPNQYKARFQTVDDIKQFRDNLNSDTNLFAEARQKHIINCLNINEIVIGKYLGHGSFRTAYMGKFRNMDVVVKIANTNVGIVKCTRHILEVVGRGTLKDMAEALYVTSCAHTATIREIINHALLDYPMVVRLLGFCVRDSEPLATNHTNVLEGGVVSVYEYGDKFNKIISKTTSWVDRVRYGRDIAALLELLHNSLLGSLSYLDVKMDHLNTVGGKMKIFDLDNYFVPMETVCRKEDLVDPDREQHLWKRPKRMIQYVDTCNYDLPCTDGLCKRTNEIDNIERCVSTLYSKFFTKGTMPEHIHGHITTFLDGVVQNKTSASDIKDFFNDILLKVNYPHPRYM